MSSRAQRRARRERGSALVSTLVFFVSLVGLLYAATAMSAVEVKESHNALEDVRTKHLADAGVERGMQFMAQALKSAGVHDPLTCLTDLFLASGTITPFRGEKVLNGNAQVGAYSVSISLLKKTSTSVTVNIDSTGYLPDAPAALPAGQEVESWHATRTTVRYSLAPSKVFDYAYFINNWGWFYGDTIVGNGNVRSNGQFDAANYAPTITGQPLYDSVSWNGSTAKLSGYQDDNGDGVAGNDGGVWSGWDIVAAQNVKGLGGVKSNQHDFQAHVDMPNLTNLGLYETSAIEQSGHISIGGVQVCDAVYGDVASEKQNLYLVGTAANPIELHGPVVVRGNLIISGYVTGQGAIYSGGNVYCPNSINYVNGPATKRPADNSQAATEAWVSSNWNKDFLGLFARENVVVGDFNNWIWQYYESWWMSDPMNSSVEDAGADGIPNTRRGRDGILGTADDDVLEGDGIFTVEHYTADDLAAGLIPPGKNVGDPIPGTGEDIDGDGVYDAQASLSNVVLATPLNTANWGGNMPAAGIADYSSIASMYANNLDAVFYTNHSFCYTVLGGQPATINGALVSRNEDIVYGTPSVSFNYDTRLLGGNSSLAAGLLPVTIQPAEIVRWTQLDRDPNRYTVAP